MGQTRYSALAKEFPEAAEALFEGAEADAVSRLRGYQKLAEV
jgi:pyruvate-ferredoxin/flavodoxin oxidoreductase